MSEMGQQATFRGERQNATRRPARPLTTLEFSDRARYSPAENKVTLRVRHSSPKPPKPPQTLLVPGVASGMA